MTKLILVLFVTFASIAGAEGSFGTKMAACRDSLRGAGLVEDANTIGKDGSFYVVNTHDHEGHPGTTIFFYKKKGASFEVFSGLVKDAVSVRSKALVKVPSGPTLLLSAVTVSGGTDIGYSATDVSTVEPKPAGTEVVPEAADSENDHVQAPALNHLMTVIRDGINWELGKATADLSDIKYSYPSEKLAKEAVQKARRHLRANGKAYLTALDACLGIAPQNGIGGSNLELTVTSSKKSLEKFLATPPGNDAKPGH